MVYDATADNLKKTKQMKLNIGTPDSPPLTPTHPPNSIWQVWLPLPPITNQAKPAVERREKRKSFGEAKKEAIIFFSPVIIHYPQPRLETKGGVWEHWGEIGCRGMETTFWWLAFSDQLCFVLAFCDVFLSTVFRVGILWSVFWSTVFRVKWWQLAVQPRKICCWCWWRTCLKACTDKY